MPEFTFNLYPSFGPQVEASRQRLAVETASFVEEYRSIPSAPYTVGGVRSLAEEVKDGRFWHALGMIDGIPGKVDGSTEISQNWAKKHLGTLGLQRALDVSVNTALLPPTETHWPGQLLGHSIFYGQVVQNKYSMFNCSVTPEVRKRFVNGMFWENLHHMNHLCNGSGYGPVGSVLTDHVDDMDASFAAEGQQLFRRSSNFREFDLNLLSYTAIFNYSAFIRTLHNQKDTNGLTDETLGELFAPYITSFFELNDDGDLRIAPDAENGFLTRFGDSTLQHYLGSSAYVRAALAKTFGYMADTPSFEGVVDRALVAMPNGAEIFNGMIRKASDQTSLLALDALRQGNLTLDEYLEMDTRTKLFTERTVSSKGRRRRKN